MTKIVSEKAKAAAAAQSIMRGALKASLATIDANSGFPYASLVTVAFRPDGTPVMLLSRLAVHTRNLEADSRASLLFDASDGAGDPLAGGRVTVLGRVARVEPDDQLRRRFLARHPGAQLYVDFADFGFWSMAVERAHYIGGFGRIVDLGAGEMLNEVLAGAGIVAAEADIVAHMNADHADAVQLYATRTAGRADGTWRMTGIDPWGMDLVAGDRGVRVPFEAPLQTPADVRERLVALARQARG